MRPTEDGDVPAWRSCPPPITVRHLNTSARCTQLQPVPDQSCGARPPVPNTRHNGLSGSSTARCGPGEERSTGEVPGLPIGAATVCGSVRGTLGPGTDFPAESKAAKNPSSLAPSCAWGFRGTHCWDNNEGPSCRQPQDTGAPVMRTVL